MRRIDDYAIGYQGNEETAQCGKCGSDMEIVRPGKWQCPKCELDGMLQQAREEGKKQAARECIDLCCKIMKKVITSNVGCGDYKHSCAHFNELEFMKQVKDKFGLEG